eukprot:g46474.t1
MRYFRDPLKGQSRNCGYAGPGQECGHFWDPLKGQSAINLRARITIRIQGRGLKLRPALLLFFSQNLQCPAQRAAFY